jgi:hypothetical protein
MLEIDCKSCTKRTSVIGSTLPMVLHKERKERIDLYTHKLYLGPPYVYNEKSNTIVNK